MNQVGFLNLKKDIKTYYKGVLLVAVYIVGANVLFGDMCPGVLLTGLPCPACGLTRAGVYVLTFQFQEAWVMNPVIYVIGAFLLYFLVCRYILGKFPAGFKWMLWTILIILLSVYIYRMINCFPEYVLEGNYPKTPMIYREKNLFRMLISYAEQ
ncbi:MAG: DUF2752 domain-containing protein [Lachnospiraceae bacterium]|nr:DUF2752 domain-containing protein [Lachnospiraceae bacterium]